LLNALRIFVATLVALIVLVFVGVSVLAGGMRLLIAVLVSAVLATIVTVWVARRTRGPASALSWRSSLQALRRGAEGTLAVCGAMTLTAFAATAFVIQRPAQAMLVAHFHEHRAAYESLRDMVREDGLGSVEDGGRRFGRDPPSPFVSNSKGPEDLGLPAERAAEYRRLLSATGGSSIYVWSGGEIAFPAAGWGAANHGWRVAIFWSKSEPVHLLPSIDNFRKKEPSKWERASSRIDGEWYVGIVLK
jgi:hypothetical protein